MRALLAPSILSVFLALGAAPEAQCIDPVTPAGGFGGYVEVQNTFITFTDGYRTVLDFRYPSATAGACGWPLMILIPPGGLDKTGLAPIAKVYANLGYAVVTFDPRGQGSYTTLNDPLVYPRSYIALRDRIDLFELMEIVEGLWPALIDFDRIGVTGSSSGGRYAWWAAAHSGQLPPTNPWRTAAFPTVALSIPEWHTADRGNLFIPEGRAIHPLLMFNLFSGASGLSPAELTLLQTPVLNEDYPALKAALIPPELALPPLLAQTTVPWLASLSYDDLILSAQDGILGTFAASPPGLPIHVNYSTGAHGSPRNDRETIVKLDARLQWMGRFLKGIPTGIDTGPAVRFPTTPEDIPVYLDWTSLWGQRFDSQPDPALPSMRFYLEAGGALSSTAPTASSGNDTINHASTIDVLTFSQILPSARILMQNYIPLSTIPYDSPPLKQDSHMMGTADMRIFASCPTTRYQIHGALYDVDPLGNERFVCDGFTTVRDNLPAGINQLDFSTYVQSYIFRAGHQIRLRLENLTLMAAPTGVPTQLRALPVFESSVVDILREVGNASFIDIPVAPMQTSFVSSVLVLKDTQYDDVDLGMHTSSDSAGNPYLMLLGVSGTNPGVDIGGVHYALNPDALTNFALATPLTAPFGDLFGTLDLDGYATGHVNLAGLGPLGLAGASISGIALDIDPLTAGATPTEPFSIIVNP